MRGSGADPWRPCACCVNLCEFTQALIMLVLKAWFLWCPPCPLGLSLFLLPFPWYSLSPQGMELTETSLLGLSSPRSLTYCTMSDGGSLSLLTILHRRQHLWWWPSKALTYAYSRMSLGVILLLCFILFYFHIFRTGVFGFT